jgi:dTDP-4-dehydrorhamnose reductase
LKKKVLIFGGTGLLGTNLVYNFQKHFQIYLNFHKKKFFSKYIKYVKVLDGDKINKKDIIKKISAINPEIIINCAANTDLEFCEKKPRKTVFVNSKLPEILSQVALQKNIKFVHFSTDHLYSGKKNLKTKNIEHTQ